MWGCISAEREAGPLVGPYDSQILPESILVQLAWFPNLSQANSGWLWTWPFLLGIVSTMAHLASWHLSHTHHISTSLILICEWRCVAADPAPWSAGEGGLEAGLLHLLDQHFLAISWEISVYVNRALPYGLRSALKIFTAIADMIAWTFHRAGIQDQSRYLDDFLFLGPPATDVAARPLSVAPWILDHLGACGITFWA